MELHVEQTLIEYLEKYGYLFENDSLILQEEIEVKKIEDKYKKKGEDLEKKKASILQKVKDFAVEVGEGTADEFREKLEDKLEEKIKKIKTMFYLRKQMLNMNKVRDLKKVRSGKSGILISGVALSALLIFSAFSVYKNEKKFGVRYCKHKRGLDRKKCLKNSYKYALIKRLNFLRKSINKCGNSKDPVACKSNVHKEMLKVQERIKDITSEKVLSTIKNFD